MKQITTIKKGIYCLLFTAFFISPSSGQVRGFGIDDNFPLNTKMLFYWNGKTYFSIANFEYSTNKLYVNGGPGTGNRELATFSYSAKIVNFTVVNDKIYFTVGNELWMINANTASASKLDNFGNEPYNLVHGNGKLYFLIQTEKYGNEIWMAEGSVVKLFYGLRRGGSVKDASDLTVMGDFLYFSVWSPFGRKIWKEKLCKIPPLATANYSVSQQNYDTLFLTGNLATTWLPK